MKDTEDKARVAEEKNELKKQIEELRVRQDGFEESLFQRICADVQAQFGQARLNVDTLLRQRCIQIQSCLPKLCLNINTYSLK